MSTPLTHRVPTLSDRLAKLYGEQADEALAALETATAQVIAKLDAAEKLAEPRWTERDVVLITYADQLRQEGETPLATQREWLTREGFEKLLSTVHLLPFCPYSSDDGFSVIDYLEVDPDAGSWEDIAALGEPFDLMFDLVLNHISDRSEWFQAYTRGEAPFDRFFIEVDEDVDLSAVVRPRPGPPWKEVATAGGTKRVWSTFSDGAVKDQMDLNYAEPRVLAEMLRVLLEYAHRGARIVRLDAVAFLWKTLGTDCLHLPETHEVVKLCRDVLEATSPRTLVLTETNVPHAENVSYFGQVDPSDNEGDEAHMVYNFSLPPLLLDAFVSGDASAIGSWLTNLEAPPPGCTFFNFTASHDGIGLRPLEGLVSDERLAKIVEYVTARGGKVNMRARPDGTESPYELNITYVDAMSPEDAADTELHARRFLSSQAVMLALRGVPAAYFHSLVGTPNDHAGVEATGQNRRINRHKYTLPELDAHLSGKDSLAAQIYAGYRELLALRQQPAFHPDAPQQVVDTGNDAVLAFKRTSLDGGQAILVAVNFSGEPQTIAFEGSLTDLQSGTTSEESLPIPPGGFVYLANNQ